MTEKIIQLKKQVEAGKFKEVFDYLDLYFEENPFNQYSTIKMNIEHQINMGFAPNPMQVQGFQLFLNSSKIKEIIPIVEKNKTTTTQKTTETMAYGIEKEIEGIKKAIDLLLEKKNDFLKAHQIASVTEKFSLGQHLKMIEEELAKYRQQIQKLKGENPTSSELKELDNKTQKAQEEIKESLKEEKKTSVFISYNHNDKDLANRIKDFLRKEGVDVTIDSEAMGAGEDIKTFIEKCVRENDIILSLVSKNSLLSAWVAMESVLAFAGEKLVTKKFIAVYEDASFFERSFVRESMVEVRNELQEVENEIDECNKLKIGIEHLQDERTRYRKLETNLAEIVGRLRNSLCIDISGNNFEKGMQKICNDIK